VTAAEDRQKAVITGLVIIQTSMRATEALVFSSSRDGQPCHAKRYTRAVLPTPILACSSTGAPARIFRD
jgi:hypothetical protein